MGLELGLSAGTAGSVDLSDGTNCIIREGGYLANSADDDREWVTEEIRLVLRGTTSQIRTTIASIERILNLAAEYYGGGGFSVVTLTGRWNDTDDYYSSDVRGGYIARPDYDSLSGGNLLVSLYVERKNYWYGTEIAIPATRGAETAPFEISDCNDGAASAHGARYNYVDFNESLTDIPGSLPAGVRIQFQTGASGLNMGRLYIYHGMFEIAPAISHEYQGSGSQTAGTSALAGSNYRRLSLNGTYQSITVAQSTNIAPGLTQRDIAIIGRVVSTPSVALNYYLKTEYGWTSSPKIAILPNQLMVFGSAQPAPLWGVTGQIDMYIKTADGSSQTLDCDFFHAMPHDGWLAVDANISAGAGVIFAYDCTRDQNVFSYGSPLEGTGLYLRPGMVNRLYFLWDRVDRTYNADDYLNIYNDQIWIVPRRRLL